MESKYLNKFDKLGLLGFSDIVLGQNRWSSSFVWISICFSIFKILMPYLRTDTIPNDSLKINNYFPFQSKIPSQDHLRTLDFSLLQFSKFLTDI